MMNNNNEIPLIYKKRVERTMNKIVLPKEACKKLGYYFYLQVYKDKIVLLPMTEEEFYGTK